MSSVKRNFHFYPVKNTTTQKFTRKFAKIWWNCIYGCGVNCFTIVKNKSQTEVSSKTCVLELFHL